MIDNMVPNNEKKSRAFPFLIRFAQKCTSEDLLSGDKQSPPHTLITKVRRETTDDR